ncbi:hypothetical protein ACGF5M_03110 [Gemmatimonadota bacterium]
MRTLREHIWEDIEPAFKQAQAAGPVLGQHALSSAVCQSLYALLAGGEPELIQLDQQCGPEKATADLPFVSVGSGAPDADPFLAFLRRVFWSDRLPTLAEGKLAAIWAIYHVIQVSPGGVADPMQMMVLTAEGVREIPDSEVGEHREWADEAEAHLAKYSAMDEGDEGPNGTELSAPPEPDPPTE